MALLMLTIICLAAPSARAKAIVCDNGVIAALEALNRTPALEAARKGSSELLAGEANSNLNRARRELQTKFTAQPALAKKTVDRLTRPGILPTRDPAEVMMTMDALVRSQPKYFASIADKAADAVEKIDAGAAAAPAWKDTRAVHWQLGNRMMSSLNLLPPREAARVVETIAKHPWLLQQFAKEHNAARALLTAMTNLEPAMDAKLDRILPALEKVANAWVAPRKTWSLAKSGEGQSTFDAYNMDRPATEWGFARALAVQMSRFLENRDLAASRRFAADANALEHAPEAAEYAKDERVAQLFTEFKVGSGEVSSEAP